MSICTKWASKLKVVHFWLKRCYSKFIFSSAFIYLQSSLLFQHGKKAMKIYLLPSTCFCYYKKHPNNDYKICPLPSTCFQQHFHDWFSILRYSSYLPKLKWTLLLYNFNYIHNLTNRCKLFSILVAKYAFFRIRLGCLKLMY